MADDNLMEYYRAIARMRDFLPPNTYDIEYGPRALFNPGGDGVKGKITIPYDPYTDEGKSCSPLLKFLFQS